MKSTGKKTITSFFKPTNESLSKKQRITEKETPVTEISTPESSDQKVAEVALEEISPTKSSLPSPSTSLVPSSSLSTSSTSTFVSSWEPLDYLEEEWKSILIDEFSKPYFSRLSSYLDSEMRTSAVFPPMNQLFTAFQLCKFSDVKVVIIGQDPYHAPGQAHGLAFSVMKGVTPPPSLRNMFTELSNDLGLPKPSHGNLSSWATQGVLLLNTSLSVRKGEPLSHQQRGWEEFTDAVVRRLGRREGIVYLLWGKPAQTKCKEINKHKNRILTSSHPSPLAAYKTNEPFMGSKIFSRCNEALISLGQTPIDWSIQ